MPDITFPSHCTANMADNLNIKGIRSPDDEKSEGVREDEPRSRGKARSRGRKPFALECRLVHTPDAPERSVFRQLNLEKWWLWGRYTTASRRDQAYAALVKKTDRNSFPRWSRWEYRKRDD